MSLERLPPLRPSPDTENTKAGISAKVISNYNSEQVLWVKFLQRPSTSLSELLALDRTIGQVWSFNQINPWSHINTFYFPLIAILEKEQGAFNLGENYFQCFR